MSGTSDTTVATNPPAPGQSPARPARRWQFSLRGLLVAMVLLGAVGGWLGSHVQRSVAQRRAVDRLQRAGAEVTITVAGPPALRRWLGDRWFERADIVTFRQSRCDDATLADVALLPGLRVLQIDSPNVTDAALVALAGHDGLQQLWVAGTQITPAGLAGLRGLDGLDTVGLSPEQCESPVFVWLADKPRLTGLAIIGPGLSLEQAQGLAKLGRLASLLLLGGAASDEVAPALAKLEGLKMLYLESPRVTDQTLAELAPLANLQNLILVNTAATDAGTAKLQAALPPLYIRLEPPPPASRPPTP